MIFCRHVESVFLVSALLLSCTLLFNALLNYYKYQNVTYAQIGKNSPSELNDSAPISHKYSATKDDRRVGIPGLNKESFTERGNETPGIESDFPFRTIGHQSSLLLEIFDEVRQDLNESGMLDLGF